MLRLLTLVVLASSAALAQPAESSDAYGTGHPGFEAALSYAIPFGQSIVSQGDTLIAFGLAITAPSVPNVIAVHDEGLTGQQALTLTIETLRSVAVQGVAGGEETTRPVIAVALVLDILTDVPGRSGKTDALAVILEAPDVPGARAYILPYVRDGRGGIEYLDPYQRTEPAMLLPQR